ncbi:MAG: N-acetyl-gamma-glutamyl-phosphate reductase [Pseudomonadota bacterium]
MKKNIAILGASGYTGAELIRFLLRHEHINIKILTAESQAGKKMSEVYPHLAFSGLPDLIPLNQVDYSGIDIVFCCLPHGTTQEVIASLPEHIKIIDLSADFRFDNIETYKEWYGHAHLAPDLQKTAIYGLTEINRAKIKEARLVANPGCYPTSAQLPLIPLLQSGLIETSDIIIDAKSGVTGAGRAAKQAMLFTEVNDGINAYGIAPHRHAPEIEQGLSQASGNEIIVNFTPHLMPMNRGILSSIYVKLKDGKTVNDLDSNLRKFYEKEYFVKIAEKGLLPSTQMVRGTNLCVIGVFPARISGRAIIISVIDNLVKGASGQAIQNMNLMLGLPENTSITDTAVFP